MANNIDEALSKLVNNVTVASSLQVPEFNASDPEMWFAVVEAYFSKARVTDEQQRYLDMVPSLPPRYANEVRDVIMHPLDNDSYAILKRELIKRLCSSQEEKFGRLLEHIKVYETRLSSSAASKPWQVQLCPMT
jgi:hypothetical protein